jgi:hypothetical protein
VQVIAPQGSRYYTGGRSPCLGAALPLPNINDGTADKASDIGCPPWGAKWEFKTLRKELPDDPR